MRAVALWGALWAGGCVTPDGPHALPDMLPDAAVAYLEPDTVRTVRVGPGVSYRYVWSAKGPWAVHLVQADLSASCDLELGVLQAASREAGDPGRERVSSMVARASEPVLAAINADFFTSEGGAVGTELTDGTVRSATARPLVAWRQGGAPWIGTATLDADSLRVGWPVSLESGDGQTEAVGGFPELLDEGERVGDLEVSERPSFAAARHPRTGVGYDPRSGWTWLVVVDGRQAPHSDGMTLPELTGLFEALGVTEAINLDGGGSSVMVVAGEPVTRPSDFTGERPVVNALALRQDPRGCRLEDPVTRGRRR